MATAPPLRLGQVSSIRDASIAFNDLQVWLEKLMPLLVLNNDTVPGTGDIALLVREDDGNYHQWTLVAGAGVTITLDAGLRTATFTSP